LEELAIMRWNGIRCFIVAGFGGMAGELEATMLRQFSEGNLLAWDEVDKMAKWSESGDEYVGTLLTHFARYRDSLLVKREGSLASEIRLHPGFPLPGAPQTRVAEIDSTFVHRTSERFAEIREAVAKAETWRVGELLKTPPVGGQIWYTPSSSA